MLQIYYLSALSHIKSVPKFENHTCNDGEKKRVCKENIGFYTLKRMNIEKSFFLWVSLDFTGTESRLMERD